MGMVIPPPIFSVSLELESATQEAKLETALAIACRDDPSLSYGVDAETGQLLLSGIGELHLDVAVDRLKREHGLNLYVGRPQVALRERLSRACSASFLFDRVISGSQQTCNIKLSVEPLSDLAAKPKAVFPPEFLAAPGELRSAFVSGVMASLTRGPILGRPVCGVMVRLVSIDPPNVNPAVLRAAAAGCVAELYRVGSPEVLEPVFDVVACAPDKDTGSVLGDLTGNRRAEILSVDAGVGQSEIHATVPAAEMLDYSRALRSLTAGHGSFTSSFQGYIGVSESVLLKFRKQ